MKEELIRVLNNKLDSINSDIGSLKELNEKIDEENEQLSFTDSIIKLFDENGENNPLNFDRIVKEDFTRALDISGDEVKNLFNSGACNYDGLIYLINGIKNGVSIALTNEQMNGIEYFVQTLTTKKGEMQAKVEELEQEKNKYSINDINELKTRKDKYEKVINDIGTGKYIKDIDLLKEAIGFSQLSPSDTINVLSYVLEYNADLYSGNAPVDVEETPKEEEKSVEEGHEEKTEEVPEEQPQEEKEEETKEESEPEVEAPTEEVPEEKPQEEIPVVEIPVPEVEVPEENKELPPMEEPLPAELVSPIPTVTPVEEPLTPPVVEVNVEEAPVQPEIDNDFKDVINEKVDYETREKQEEEKTSTRELHKIFGKYGIEENVVLNELIDGDVKEYQHILDSLKDHNVLDYFKKNKELLIETLLYSGNNEIDKVLRIIKEDLSVDDEDYEITLKIVVNTIPSIFIRDGGNYDNFIKNVELFKNLGINLINLFDFSKEVFVADHESIENNLAVINKYDFDVNYKNAKYFLLIPNIAEKLDYYIESIYEDKTKGQTFDGINYIKEYAAKLNVVTDETIKRLRYASINGKKVFGNKPGSLSGEITNLKVNALDLNPEYLNSFFNNEFINITPDEVRQYVKLVHSSSNVGDYGDELDKLKSYQNGLRYNFEGVNVSYNKVTRIYSVLRSYGIDPKKALQFAVCYNLVITKDEYNKLNDLLERIGGNV